MSGSQDMAKPSLSRLLKLKQKPLKINFDQDLEALELRMLRIQQGIWHQKKRALIVFEGADAAGKGGAIRRLVEKLDPRGVHVHGIGAPNEEEKGQHYLARFWEKLPEPGSIAIFDRSWYGRVLVEQVEKLAPKKRLKEAYSEINEFEKMLVSDGIELIKIFMAISKSEQLKRYEDRLNDPYKQWKLSDEDIRNRRHWEKHVRAADEMFEKTSTSNCEWKVLPADHKPSARHLVLSYVTDKLHHHEKWMSSQAAHWDHKHLKKTLKKLG